MATSKNTSSVQDDVDEMFGTDAKGSDDFADVDDLLDEVEEDDSEGWVPAEKGEGIAGKLVKVSVTKSDFANEGEDPNCPTWTIQTKNGDKYRVIGYGAVLKREMIDSEAEVGDYVAVKYFGERPIKKGRFAGKPYKHFGVAVRRAS